jgi:hypothetical protein
MRRQSGRCPHFYAAVYRLVAQIPHGKVTTYGQIARWLASQRRQSRRWCMPCPPARRFRGNGDQCGGRVSSRCDRHYEGIQRASLKPKGKVRLLR